MNCFLSKIRAKDIFDILRFVTKFPLSSSFVRAGAPSFEVIKDEAGKVVELRCSHDPDTRQGAGKKVKGIIHWVSEDYSARSTVCSCIRHFQLRVAHINCGRGDL